VNGFRFDDVTALVTGAARGMGAAEATALAECGAHVLVADVLEDQGRELAETLGPRGRFVSLDVTREGQWAQAVQVPASWPPLRALVNNAGVTHATPLESETADHALGLWKVNVLGPMLGTQHVVPQMRAAGGGSIVNISSAAGLIGMASSSAYGGSKWALRGMTRTAAIELGPSGIRVNCVLPGMIETPMLRAAVQARPRREDYSHLPLGRQGQPCDIVGAVLFLLSEHSQYVTGAELLVDGGLTAGIAALSAPG
jgi:3alpha(or 20beta)-hydroxysteroid dehydrogenase